MINNSSPKICQVLIYSNETVLIQVPADETSFAIKYHIGLWFEAQE